jgi:acetyl-CoA C-acetyltransferase
MPEAVIVAAARTPIGRAYKGSLREMRPDDLSAAIIRAALAQVPELDPTTIDDLLLGCGAPGGEAGFNQARVVATLLGLETVPGATITRYCSSSLQTTRMAMHAIRAGEGHTFISAGVECISRAPLGTSDNPPVAPDADPRDRSTNPWTNPLFTAAQTRTAERAAAGTAVWPIAM